MQEKAHGLAHLEVALLKSRNENQMLKHNCTALRRQKRSSRAEKNVKITEMRTYVPLSHDYADLFANLVASLELCATTVDLWEIWRDKLKDENSKHLVQRMIIILSRYLAHPEGRAFVLYQHKGKREFYEMSERIRSIRERLEAFSLTEHNRSELENIESMLNQLARNCRLEIQRLAKAETVEYSK
jgi:cell fate (sporulation/competence/biofilm development) regulator YmcA (YheA/YmcA/DUF963 family)